MKKYLEKYLAERPLFLSLIRAKEAWLFQRYLPLKKPVLDLGCGDGFFAKTAFGHLDIGLDVADSRIDEIENGIYKKTVVCDGKKMPIEPMATVVSNCVLEHIENLDQVLGETYRILKPGGVFLTTVMSSPWENNLFINFGMYRKWMRYKQVHLNLLSDSEWEFRFKKAGFKVKEKTGYLSPTACKLIDICHYLSLPSLISYILRKKWDWGWHWYPVDWLVKIMSENVETNKSGAIFFVLEK